MTLNYYRSVRNFGDVLSRPLVEALSGISVKAAVDLPRCDVMASGSIGWGGRLFNANFKANASRSPLALWGTGLLLPLESGARPQPIRPLRICALRGALSRDDFAKAGLIRRNDDIALGDTGLFYADLVPDVRNMTKTHDVALVPHRLDCIVGERLAKCLAAAGMSVCLVDPTCMNPFDCIRAIASARRVVASSLHALVVADSLGIPNRRLVFEGYEKDGAHRVEQSEFRFSDYYSAFGMQAPKPILEQELRRRPREVVNSLAESGHVPMELVAECRRRLLAASPFPDAARVVPVSREHEWDVCSAIDREVSLAAAIVRSNLRKEIAALRQEQDVWKKKVEDVVAVNGRLGAELEILRAARQAIERVLLEGGDPR